MKGSVWINKAVCSYAGFYVMYYNIYDHCQVKELLYGYHVNVVLAWYLCL
jgi:succinate-acetate transporter protein